MSKVEVELKSALRKEREKKENAGETKANRGKGKRRREGKRFNSLERMSLKENGERKKHEEGTKKS